MTDEEIRSQVEAEWATQVATMRARVNAALVERDTAQAALTAYKNEVGERLAKAEQEHEELVSLQVVNLANQKLIGQLQQRLGESDVAAAKAAKELLEQLNAVQLELAEYKASVADMVSAASDVVRTGNDAQRSHDELSGRVAELEIKLEGADTELERTRQACAAARENAVTQTALAGKLREALVEVLAKLHLINAYAGFIDRWREDRTLDPTDEIARLAAARLQAHELIVSATKDAAGAEARRELVALRKLAEDILAKQPGDVVLTELQWQAEAALRGTR